MLMAVSVPAPAVIPEIFSPFSVPEPMPADWISIPLLLMVAAAPLVIVLTFRPSIVQVPPVHDVIIGAATLTPLIVGSSIGSCFECSGINIKGTGSCIALTSIDKGSA